MTGSLSDLAEEYAARLSPDEVAELARKVRAQAARLRAINTCPTPLDLACRYDHGTVRTPALELVSHRLVESVRARDGRLVVSVPPQEFKTSTLRWLCLWLLADDPGRRIVFASYAHQLARTSGRIVRGMVYTHGHEMGLAVSDDHADASDWQLAGHEGGMFTTGVGGSLTGRPSDVMIIDDPIRNRQDADSEVIRANLHEWWQSVARTRLAPGAPVIIVQTRWHEDDLAGRRIAEDWPAVNIPALADGDTDDSLDREPGTYLESTRGRTPDDWESIRADIGERDWAALYQGRPAPIAGGIFEQAWFDNHRVQAAPELTDIAVGVDPAETGTGDEAGILVAGTSTDRQMYLLADLSGALSQAQWGRRACLAYLTWNAGRIVVERNLGMGKTIPDTWRVLRQQATALATAPNGNRDPAHGAARALVKAGNEAAADEGQLREVQPLVAQILAHPHTGPRVVTITPKQGKRVRAQAVTSLFELGRAHIVGRLPLLEHEAVVWQEGQPSPNRIDVMAMLLSHMDLTGQVAVKSSRPTQRIPTRTGSSRAAR